MFDLESLRIKIDKQNLIHYASNPVTEPLLNTVSSPGQVFSGEIGLVSLAPQGAEVRVHVLSPVQAGLGGRWPAHLSLVVRVDAVPRWNVPLQGSRRGVKPQGLQCCPFQA